MTFQGVWVGLIHSHERQWRRESQGTEEGGVGHLFSGREFTAEPLVKRSLKDAYKWNKTVLFQFYLRHMKRSRNKTLKQFQNLSELSHSCFIITIIFTTCWKICRLWNCFSQSPTTMMFSDVSTYALYDKTLLNSTVSQYTSMSTQEMHPTYDFSSV